ncbi:CLUMA_CG016236, isoform B [Clunio marinus]|uniref:E3 ubiquitin-protein ligase parkin n=1 Tax=Clunio marinus TaxID=568069 RepID=A0A1J1IT55_9DIPT|nr:CLUMA_CG016236, isoform B [Clunio marinus]
MKLYRIVHHQRSVYPEDLLLNPKEHPTVKKGDIVEIYHPEDDDEKGQQRCRLLLQVSLAKDSQSQSRDYVSVESSIALTFNLKNYGDVYMRVINDPASVALDSVEITFKDQYMGRSEMWRLKQFLTNTCVYINKKIEYCESIRCQVYEMWSMGERVACGVINDDTKVVFRSCTSLVYLFIQMSSEMWDFDIHGDLYFEKAVNGFLTDLFAKWKKQSSNHEVTIVLFSRTFYAAKCLDEFPVHMRDCLQQDYRGRYYEDFYRVAIQNERNDDWSTILVQLRRLFTAYQDMVLNYHQRPGVMIPPATNSTAAQGNFLEVLNISLNVFEKHYLDRSFDRTGQLSVVITPGVGVFEVDRELTNITKQRIIDNGVSSDLVCVGEQPLHAVPLLKFHYKDSSLTSVDDYSMPHWINLSFYSTNKKVAYSSFIPRIKLPPLIKKNEEEANAAQIRKLKEEISFYDDSNTEYIHNSLFDYDAYDAQVFVLPSHGTSSSLQRLSRTKKISVPSLDGIGVGYSTSVSSAKEWDFPTTTKSHRRKMSDPDIHHSNYNNIYENNSPVLKESVSQSALPITAATVTKISRKSLHRTTPFIRNGRALINPFDPSHVTIKLTSNRRRWSHIFPKGPTGVLIQQHHYQAVPTTQSSEANFSREDSFTLSNCDDYAHTSLCQVAWRQKQNSISKSFEKFDEDFNRSSVNNTPVDRLGYLSEQIFGQKRKPSMMNSPFGSSATATPSKTLLWGATGEQEWTPALTTAGKTIIGVDWKSLTIPACLPITTDYFPDKRSLNNDYVLSIYQLLPDDVNADFMRHRAVQRKPLSTEEVFKELVSQRLAQGFQLIVLPEPPQQPSFAPCCGGSIQTKPSPSVVAPVSPEHTKEFLLSIGRIFHKITLTGSEIKVTRYRPRHAYTPINVDYRYRFHAPNHDTYEVSGVRFTTEKLENFSWNHMDQYICTRGDTDFMLQESLKYWRYRMYLLPKDDPIMKRIIDENTEHCDVYIRENSQLLVKQQVEEFLRFVETHLNKIKRVKKPRGSPTTQQSHLTRRRHSTSTSIQSRPPAVQNQTLQNSPFRERVGSNRYPERLRPRSGSKIETKSMSMALQATLAEKATLKGESEDNDDCFAPEPPKLKSSSPITEIFEAFKNPLTGVGFLEPLPSMPSLAFCSYDAIMWLHNRIEGVIDAIEILEIMRSKKLICHASGDFTTPIIAGFYLYYIVNQDPDSPDFRKPLGDREAFENEWMEVEIPLKYVITNPSSALSSPSERILTEVDVPSFLRDEYNQRNIDGRLYRQSHLEVDLSSKSDRIEWGHARYHKQFQPGSSFEITVQWLTASGPIVFDLIYGWIRKAQQCGYQLVPIPADPMAEPFIDKSDPLRGPMFVPLNIDCLMQNRSELFEDFKKETWADRMLLFQDEIVRRFGFVMRACETQTGTNDISVDWQYVHVTGNMFILVPSSDRPSLRRLGLSVGGHSSPLAESLGAQKRLKNYYHGQQDSGPQKENYISRHVQKDPNVSKDSSDDGFSNGISGIKIGFLWQWNHMIANKKWKSLVINGTDELFQLRLLRIGRDLVKALVENGANVVGVSRSAGPLDALKEELKGKKFHPVQLDLGNWKLTKETLGKLDMKFDGIVNNAGIAVVNPIEKVTEEEIDLLFNVNWKGCFNVIQTLLPKIKEGGSIVNVSSVSGLTSFWGHGVYSSTKAALDALTTTLAIELAPKKIRVNSVNPTVILTKLGREAWADPEKSNAMKEKIPFKRFGEIKEVVEPIMFLLSDQSSYINGIKMPIEDPQWDIEKVKELVAPQLGLQPNEVKIIFAGKELEDSTTISECDLGQKSVLHAVKARSRRNEEIKTKKCLESIFDEAVEDAGALSSKPFSSTLIDLQISNEERQNLQLADVERTKAHFFVHCPECKKLCRGKLRVRCNICKGGAFTVHRDPSCWEDVLEPNRIHGHCESNEIACVSNEENDLPFAEFYFKCAEHPSGGEKDFAAPLNLIKTNLKNVPCLACGDVNDPVIVFPCAAGHVSCLDCFQLYCSSRLQDRQFMPHPDIGYTLPCPVGCENSFIEEVHHFKLLSKEQYDRYQRFATEEFVLQSGGVLCPQPNCGMGIIVDEDCTRVHCLSGCGFVFCKNCRQGFHIGDCIPDSPAVNNTSSSCEYAVDPNRVAGARWDESSKITIKVTTKPCPKCRTPTERAGGCMHMACTRAGCNFEWCWICQTEWTRDCMGAHWFG